MSSSNMPSNPLRSMATGLLAGAVIFSAACSGISPATKERVAQTEMAVQQAQTTVGTSESGAIELQRAREHMANAKRALEDEKEGVALRHATEAQLSAELAIAKSQSASARKAAEDMLASIETLRREAIRDEQPVAR